MSDILYRGARKFSHVTGTVAAQTINLRSDGNPAYLHNVFVNSSVAGSFSLYNSTSVSSDHLIATRTVTSAASSVAFSPYDVVLSGGLTAVVTGDGLDVTITYE